MSQPYYIRKVAVLGSGVMGAQIAAHMINAGIPALLFDLPATDNDNLNYTVLTGIDTLLHLQPPAFTLAENVDYLQPCNYAQDLAQLLECDLIIEAISESLEIKLGLYKQISSFIGKNSLLVSNTSGLSINRLAQSLSEELRARFFGVHFFNPPRYMTLVELIPGIDSDRNLIEKIEAFLVSTLGKGIVYAQDTPNFVGNRIGIFSMLITLHYAEQFNLKLDVVDALTGPLLGRPKSATLRTVDVVGLDTFAHAVATMTNGLPDDPWHAYFKLPEWMQALIASGALGQKTRKGIYQKQEDGIYVYDIDTHNYRPSSAQISAEIKTIFAQKNFADVMQALRNSQDPQAQFLWSCYREVFHYSAYHLETITSTVRDVDCAMRWGFGWQQGPFECWQGSGWRAIAELIQHDIATEHAATHAALPAWVNNVHGVYAANGAFSPDMQTYLPRRPLPVYERQLYPELMPEELPLPSHTLYENESVRVWHTGDDIAIVSFKTKLGAIDNGVLDGVRTSIELAIGLGRGLILWNNAPQFTVGANLKNILLAAQQNLITDIETLLENFQQCTSALRYSPIPTVAAVRGYVLGGGCEILLHCDRVVAALESMIGLVETSVGVVPAGGGCAAMIQRAWEMLPEDPYPLLEKYYLQIANGLRTQNAAQALQAGYLRAVDKITFNPYELLFLAKQQVLSAQVADYHAPMAASNNQPRASQTHQERLYQAWLAAHAKYSAHDARIARDLSYIFGLPIPETVRDVETELLRREREVFVSLIQTPETQARIEYLLNTGKPLKN